MEPFVIITAASVELQSGSFKALKDQLCDFLPKSNNNRCSWEKEGPAVSELLALEIVTQPICSAFAWMPHIPNCQKVQSKYGIKYIHSHKIRPMLQGGPRLKTMKKKGILCLAFSFFMAWRISFQDFFSFLTSVFDNFFIAGKVQDWIFLLLLPTFSTSKGFKIGNKKMV